MLINQIYPNTKAFMLKINRFKITIKQNDLCGIQYMPKSNSQPETIVPARTQKINKKLRWIQQRTLDAVEYYSKTKKETLKSAKLKYLQKIGETEQSIPTRSRLSQKEEQQPQLRRLTQLSHIYKQESQSDIAAANYMAEEAAVVSQQSSISSEAHYQLRPIHEAALQVQKIIDICLDFHFTNRKRRSLSRQELVNYLQTTKYGLNCERYINILSAYNRHAYRWESNRIFCQQFTAEQMGARVEATRERMKRKRMEELPL